MFLASPGDVVDERELALKVLETIRYEPFIRGKVTIEDVAWDKKGAGAPILAGITPQDSIKAGLPRPSECDIVVVLFWSRMGTPLPAEYRFVSGTQWEYEDAIDGFRRNGTPYVLLYRRTQKVLLNPDDADFYDRARQRELVRAFFDGLKNESGYTGYESPSEFGEKLAHDIKSLIARILETPPRAESTGGEAPKLWEGSPFPGLRAFTAADAPIFFGREREIDALIARVMEYPFVAVVGASGSGKSSLVAAGAIPRLELTAAGGRWLPIAFTPDQLGGGDPFASTAAALVAIGVRQKNLAASLRQAPSHLRDLLQTLDARPLLFIDQFEELFTTIAPTARDAFIEMLRLVAECDAVRTVITLRADFYAKCVEHQSLARLVESSTFPLSAPGGAALRDMIERPAARAGLTFEESLPQRILDDTGNEPGSLALMAYTLDELYRAASSGVLTHAAYDEIGRVQGAIGKRSEAVFANLGDAEKAALPRVFRELVDVDERGTATRQRARLSRIADSPPAARLTEALTEARLLVQSRGENNEPVVEVAHEALFRSWFRLADWIKDTQDDLRLLRQVRIAAADWDANGRRDDFLWSHERLVPVYAARDRLDIEFESPVADFIRPEFERIADEIRADQRFFRQRPHFERLIEIGVAAVPTLVQVLSQAKTESARELVYRGLLANKEVASPHLIKACRARREPLQHFVEALERLGARKALPLLPGLFEHRPVPVRVAAARLAAHLGDPGSIPLLRERIADQSESVRKAALKALATFSGEEAVDALLTGLHSRSSVTRQTTLELIGLLARQGHPPRFLTFRHAQEDVDGSLRQLIVQNMGTIRRPEQVAQIASRVVPLLAGDNDVAEAAARVLGILRRPETAPPLLEIALKPEKSTAADAGLRALTLIAAPGYVDDLFLLLGSGRQAQLRAAREIAGVFDNDRWLGESANPNLRAALRRDDIAAVLMELADRTFDLEMQLVAAKALLGMEWAPALPLFQQLMDSTSDPIAVVGIEGVGRLGGEQLVPALIEMLALPDELRRGAAAESLLALNAANFVATLAADILTHNAHVLRRSAYPLVRIVERGKPKEARSFLEQLTRRPDATPAVEEAAREALKRLSATSSPPPHSPR